MQKSFCWGRADNSCDDPRDSKRCRTSPNDSDENPQQTVLRDDLLQTILTHLPWWQVFQVRRVSRAWREAVDALQLRCEPLREENFYDGSLHYLPFESIWEGAACEDETQHTPKDDHEHNSSYVEEPSDKSPTHHVTLNWIMGEAGPRYTAKDIADHAEICWWCEPRPPVDDDLQNVWAGLFRFRDVWIFIESKCCDANMGFYCWGHSSIILSRRLDALLRSGLVPRGHKQHLLKDCKNETQFYWRIAGPDDHATNVCALTY